MTAQPVERPGEEVKQILHVIPQTNRGHPSNHPDFTFWCPGCKCEHEMFTTKKNCRGAVWSFNGDMVSATFAPSLLLDQSYPRCHLFITGGMIQFLGDCTHELAGKTVPMEAF